MTIDTYASLPKLNPLRFVTVSGGIDDKYWRDMLADFEKADYYAMPVQWNDVLRMQIDVDNTKINVATMYVGLYDCKYNQIQGLFNADMVWLNGDYINITSSLVVPEVTGYYYVKIVMPKLTTGDVVMYSEPLWIKQEHKNTSLIEVTCDGIKQDVFFTNHSGNNLVFSKRVKGGFRVEDFETKADVSVFVGQTHSYSIVNGVAFNEYTFIVGDNKGVPNYEIDIINRMLLCEYLTINDVSYCRNGDSGFEKTNSPNWGKQIWRIKLGEAVNDTAKTVVAVTGDEADTGDLMATAIVLVGNGTDELDNGGILNVVGGICEYPSGDFQHLLAYNKDNDTLQLADGVTVANGANSYCIIFKTE